MEMRVRSEETLGGCYVLGGIRHGREEVLLLSYQLVLNLGTCFRVLSHLWLGWAEMAVNWQSWPPRVS